MKNIFVWLLLNLIECGEIKTANMFNNGYSNLTVVTEDGEYNINIIKSHSGVENEI